MRVLAVLAAACATCAALAAGAPAPAVASHAQIVYFEAPKDLLSSKRHATFLKLERLGVTALRLELHWHDVVPGANSTRRPKFDATNPASYRWGGYDYVLTEAARLKWPVLLTVTGPAPKWATAGHRDLVTRPDDKAFEQFMTAVGRRYAPQVSVFARGTSPTSRAGLSHSSTPTARPLRPGSTAGCGRRPIKG